MALLLRLACEKPLAKADMDALHADIHPTNKNLQLYTPCGKPFAAVHGIQFSRLHPTNTEIDYAVTLLEIWLQRNQNMLDDYVTAREQLDLAVAPPTELEEHDNQLEIITKRDYDNVRKKYIDAPIRVQFIYQKVTYQMDAEERLWTISWVGGWAGWEGLIKVPKKLRKEAREFLQLNLDYSALRTKVNEIHNELNTCLD